MRKVNFGTRKENRKIIKNCVEKITDHICLIFSKFEILLYNKNALPKSLIIEDVKKN